MGKPIFSIGPHYLFSTVFIILVAIPYFAFIIFISSRGTLFTNIIGISIFLTFILSYLYTAFRNPGIALPNTEYEHLSLVELGKSSLYCKICKVIKDPAKAIIHCDECNVCVEGYDHHCPWLGKCIGVNNLMSFYAFMISLVCVICHFAITSSLLISK